RYLDGVLTNPANDEADPLRMIGLRFIPDAGVLLGLQRLCEWPGFFVIAHPSVSLSLGDQRFELVYPVPLRLHFGLSEWAGLEVVSPIHFSEPSTVHQRCVHRAPRFAYKIGGRNDP